MRRQWSRFLLFGLLAAAVIASGLWAAQLKDYRDLHRSPIWAWTPAQKKLLTELKTPLMLSVFVGDNPALKRALDELLTPLTLVIPKLKIVRLDPGTHPELVQRYGIRREGSIVLTYQGTSRTLAIPSPAHLRTAILELIHGDEETWLVHLQGHGERGFLSDTPGSWRALYQHLQAGGYHVAALAQGALPSNAAVLLIADPKLAPLAADPRLKTWLAQGGNLLYATDTHAPALPPVLQTLSGLSPTLEAVRDADGRQFGIQDSQTLLVRNLSSAPEVRKLKNSPLLQGSVALIPEHPPAKGWTRTPLLYSSSQAQAGQWQGRLVLAWMLTRPLGNKVQRVLLLGDSDLFSAPYFSAAGNGGLADSLIASLAPQHLNTAPALAPLPDQYIRLSPQREAIMALALLLGLPFAAILIYGHYLWRLRCRYR